MNETSTISCKSRALYMKALSTCQASDNLANELRDYNKTISGSYKVTVNKLIDTLEKLKQTIRNIAEISDVLQYEELNPDDN